MDGTPSIQLPTATGGIVVPSALHAHEYRFTHPDLMNTTLYAETIPGGAMWSMRIPRQRRIRLTALDAGANVSALLYNADQPLDRLNVPDTLKALHTAKLTKGHILMSDMGNALVSIVEIPSAGTIRSAAILRRAQALVKYGDHNYQQYRNDFHRKRAQ